METSNLARLPGELRNSIYEIILHQCEPVQLLFQQHGNGHEPSEQYLLSGGNCNQCALLQTCKQIYHEARKIARDNVAFKISAAPETAELALMTFISRRDNVRAGVASSLQIDIGEIPGRARMPYAQPNFCGILSGLWRGCHGDDLRGFSVTFRMLCRYECEPKEMQLQLRMDDRDALKRSIEGCQEAVDAVFAEEVAAYCTIRCSPISNNLCALWTALKKLKDRID